jgi:hypothetical protein
MAHIENSRWKEFCDAYVPVCIIWFTLCAVLALPNYNLFHGILQGAILLVLSYLGHAWAHVMHRALLKTELFSKDFVDNIFTHVSIHHNKVVDIPRWLDLLIDFVFTFSGFLSILLLQHLTDTHFFSTSAIIFSGILFNIVHILDNSIIGNDYHRFHHINEFTNYGMEVIDVLFGTRYDPDSPYTRMVLEIPYGIMAFLMTGALKLWFGWD